MEAFQYYLQSEKQGKLGWAGDDSHVAFRQQFPGEKGSVGRRVVSMQQPVFVAKVQGRSLHTLARTIPTTSKVVRRIDCFA
jgi:hypothetical protein